jgi:hypothetical protein
MRERKAEATRLLDEAKNRAQDGAEQADDHTPIPRCSPPLPGKSARPPIYSSNDPAAEAWEAARRWEKRDDDGLIEIVNEREAPID